MSSGNCRKCNSELSIPTENSNFPQIPTCKNCTPQAFGIRRPNAGKVGEKEYEAAKIYSGLDRRRAARAKIREAGSTCRSCGDHLQMSDVVSRDEEGKINELSAPACPTCNPTKFNQNPLDDAGGVSGLSPEENERLSFQKQSDSALSTHYTKTGELHSGLSTLADYADAKRKGKIAGFCGPAQYCGVCRRGVRSEIDEDADHARVDKRFPTPITVHLGDQRTDEQKDPWSRSYIEKPIMKDVYTKAQFSWKPSSASGNPSKKLQNHPVGQAPSWNPSWSQEVDESDIGSALTSAHDRGAHQGRKIADCPSCSS